MTPTMITPAIGPEGLRLSASQIETFRLCPRKWAFSRVLGGRSTASAQLGSEVHWCLELWVERGLAPAVSPLVFGKDGRYLSGATERAVTIARALIPHAPKPGTVETESDLRIVRSAATYTGRRDYMRAPEFRATMDFLAAIPQGGEYPGDLPIVGDYKTTSGLQWAKSVEDLRGDTAANVYAAAAMGEHGTDACGLEWPYIETKAPHRVRVVRLVVYRSEVEAVLRGVDDTAHAMRPYHGVPVTDVPLDASACSAFGGCPYLVECGPTSQQRIGAIMSQSALADRLRAKLGGGAPAAATTAPAVPATPVAATPAPAQAAAAPAASTGGPAPVGGLAAKLAARKAAEAAQAASAAPAPTVAEVVGTPVAARAAPASTITEAVERAVEERPAPSRMTNAKAPPAEPGRLPVDVISDKHAIGGLRDQIAIAALNGMLARGRDATHDSLASSAYALADAMLAARVA